ncbi:MAG TPA: S8 family peptidase [Nocardioidaceae bacterium]|nr:S8 family peptidase [Nocardioidaceae bacterium]
MGRSVRSLLAATVAGLMVPVAATSAVGAGTDTATGPATGPADRRIDGPSAFAAPAEPAPESAPTELLVRYRSGTSAAERADIRADVDGRLLDRLPAPGLELVHVGPDGGATVRELERRPDVLYAEPNNRVSIAATPDDPYFGRLWGLQNTGQQMREAGVAGADIDAAEAWEHTTGDPAVTVAVVDSGVAIEHPDLAANVWRNTDEVAGDRVDNDDNGFVDDVRGWDWVGADDNDPADLNGHGTHVAGTIGAVGNNGVGVAGVAWDVSLMPLRVLDAEGSGYDSDVIEAFAYAARNGADVVNASLGGPEPSPAMADVIERYPETLFVVAAGNDSSDNEATPDFPCNLEAANLLCVAATDNQDRLAYFSNYGTASVDLAAPGESILSTVPTAGYGWMDGTSMASPHVAGAAALLHAADRAATVAEVRGALLGGVDLLPSLSGRTVTGGRLNVDKALDLLVADAPRQPANTAPTDVRMTGLSRPYSTAAMLRVSATARDPDGVDHLQVRYRRARHDRGFGRWSVIAADLRAGARVPVPTAPGHTMCFSARATDGLGATSAWSASRCSAVPVDDRGLTRSAGWTRQAANGAFRGTLTVSSRRGAALRTRGAGIRRVALVATKRPGSGTVEVYHGRRRLKRISLAAARTRAKQVIHVATWASTRKGTFRVVVTTSRKPVRIDGLALGR